MAGVTEVLFTWSNALTVTRLAMIPCFVCALIGEAFGLAFVLFWAAVASDVADGRLARARGEVSAFGGLLDHATDAAFVTAGLGALAAEGAVPIALPFLVPAAFVQYVLDSKSLTGRALRTSVLGRWNGILYFVPTGVVVVRETLGLAWPPNEIVFRRVGGTPLEIR